MGGHNAVAGCLMGVKATDQIRHSRSRLRFGSSYKKSIGREDAPEL